MKLSRAQLCLNCDTLHEQSCCPDCGSTHSYPIAKWLKVIETPFVVKLVEHLRDRSVEELEKLYKLDVP